MPSAAQPGRLHVIVDDGDTESEPILSDVDRPHTALSLPPSTSAHPTSSNAFSHSLFLRAAALVTDEAEEAQQQRRCSAVASSVLVGLLLALTIALLTSAVLILLPASPISRPSSLPSPLPPSSNQSLPLAASPPPPLSPVTFPAYLFEGPGHVCIPSWGGRWGNHVYIALMAVLYGLHHHLQPHLPDCEYRPLLLHHRAFYTPCPATSQSRVHMEEWGRPLDWWMEEPRPLDAQQQSNRTFVASIQGYFQYNTSHFARWQREMEEVMRVHPEVQLLLDRLRDGMLQRYCGQGLIVGMHVRRGDFSTYAEAPRAIPVAWYVDWLADVQSTPAFAEARAAQEAECAQLRLPAAASEASATPSSNFTVLLFSDDVDAVTAELRTASPGLTVLTRPQLLSDGGYRVLEQVVDAVFMDWWLLGKLYLTATSHSTFSLTSVMFNPRRQRASFFRPDAEAMRIIQFDPWANLYRYKAFDGKLP